MLLPNLLLVYPIHSRRVALPSHRRSFVTFLRLGWIFGADSATQSSCLTHCVQIQPPTMTKQVSVWSEAAVAAGVEMSRAPIRESVT